MRHQSTHRTSPLTAVGLGLLLAAAGSVTLSQFSILNSQFTAAAQAPSLDQLLRDLSAYDGGIESEAFWKLRDHVYSRRGDEAGRAECETRLLLFLQSKATPAARMGATRLLRVIAAESAVPALQAMLADDRLADLALYVLQPMPGTAADKALVSALQTTKGATKVAVIAALGERRVAEAVPALGLLLGNPEFGKPAAIALGAIGSEDADAALTRHQAGGLMGIRPAYGSALLSRAERALASGDTAAALRLYDGISLRDTSYPASVRTAAALGRISASGTRGPSVVLELLAEEDAALQLAAIGRVRETVPPDAIGPFCTVLPRLPEASQVALLSALAHYPREKVLLTVVEAAKSGAPAVKLAALHVLPAVGDATTVPVLLEMAAAGRGPEQAAARAALAGLKGQAVDEALLTRLANAPPPDEEVELLVAAADRRIYPARPAVTARLSSSLPRTRQQALKSLRAIGTPSDIPAVLDLVVKTSDDTEQADAEATVSALAQKVSRADQRAREVKPRLAAEKDPAARARLLGVLPLVGDASTLPTLRAALSDESADVRDAAVRAITAWPSSTARDDVFRLARDSRNETHRLLAIRGLIRIVGAERYREPQAAVADLRLAAGFAWRAEEQKLVLGALGQFPCKDALDLATGYLEEPAVADEAKVTVEKLQKALKVN